jgi:hypothetical protein
MYNDNPNKCCCRCYQNPCCCSCPSCPPGPTGAQGPTGVTGATGATGAPGPAGATGATGAQGIQGIQGATGEPGPAGYGASGIQGSQGIQGVKGEIGPAGPQGIQGEAGEVGSIKGTYPTLEELLAAHPDGNPGDAYYIYPDLYIWDDVNKEWKNIGRIAGPQGIQGEQGVQGEIGATGPQGVQGEQGIQGFPGATGAAGSTGATGITGPTGPSPITAFAQYQSAVSQTLTPDDTTGDAFVTFEATTSSQRVENGTSISADNKTITVEKRGRYLVIYHMNIDSLGGSKVTTTALTYDGSMAIAGTIEQPRLEQAPVDHYSLLCISAGEQLQLKVNSGDYVTTIRSFIQSTSASITLIRIGDC